MGIQCSRYHISEAKSAFMVHDTFTLHVRLTMPSDKQSRLNVTK